MPNVWWTHWILKIKTFPLRMLIFGPKILLFRTHHLWNSTTQLILKASKFQKQIILFSILPENVDPRILATRVEVVCSFFGRIENKIICFRDLLTFTVKPVACSNDNIARLVQGNERLAWQSCHLIGTTIPCALGHIIFIARTLLLCGPFSIHERYYSIALQCDPTDFSASSWV